MAKFDPPATGVFMRMDNHRAEALELVARLSEREKRILAALVDGNSISAIAAILSIETREVEQAKRLLLEKLSADTTADAVRIGIYSITQLAG